MNMRIGWMFVAVAVLFLTGSNLAFGQVLGARVKIHGMA